MDCIEGGVVKKNANGNETLHDSHNSQDSQFSILPQRGDYLILHARRNKDVYLLAIKHHRQLSFDLPEFWNQTL